MRTRIAHLVGFIMLVITVPANAGLSAYPSLSQTVSDADCIVTGTFVGVEQVHRNGRSGDRESTHSWKYQFRKLESIKGDSEWDIWLLVPIPTQSPVPLPELPRGNRVVMLKKSTTPGEYNFVEEQPSSNLPFPVVFAKHNDSLVTATEGLLQLVESGLSLSEEREVLSALRNVFQPGVAAAFRARMYSSDERIKELSLMHLLEVGDDQALAVAKPILMGGVAVQSRSIERNLIAALTRGISKFKQSESLLELTTSPSLDVRKTLVRNHNTGKFPLRRAIYVRALDDSDFEIRYGGVIGLARLEKEPEWAPDMEAFRNNEARYLDYWRARTKQ